MKKKKDYLVVLVLVWCMCIGVGCGDDTKKEPVNQDEVSVKNESLNLEDYSLEYVDGTDANAFFKWPELTRGKGGYYFWETANRLMFYDTASKQAVYVCNKPDCTHEVTNMDCNANFSVNVNTDVCFYDMFVQYYEDHVYLLGCDEEGNVILFKITPDGSAREEYMTLFKADVSPVMEGETQNGVAAPAVCIHRGYVYFINEEEDNPLIRRMKLGTDKVEEVFATSGIRPNLYRMKAHGDYVFFQAGNFVDESYEKIEGGIYAYNINTGKIQMAVYGAISSYFVYDEVVYYSTENEIKSFSLRTQEDKSVVSGLKGYSDCYTDGKHIFVQEFFGTTSILVYDMNGNSIGEIADTNDRIGGWCLGDSSYMFAKPSSWGDLAIIDLSNTMEDSFEWTFINEPTEEELNPVDTDGAMPTLPATEIIE